MLCVRSLACFETATPIQSSLNSHIMMIYTDPIALSQNGHTPEYFLQLPYKSFYLGISDHTQFQKNKFLFRTIPPSELRKLNIPLSTQHPTH